MVNKYKRKTTKASWDEDVMRLAMEEAKRTTVLGAAKKYGLKLSTLQQHIKKGCHKKKLGRYRPIFTDDQEKELLELCQSDTLDGLTRKEFLIIAYEYAEAKNISNPFKNGAAGVDWYFGFKKRHPGFNLARATTAENLYKVDAFCQLLEKKMKFDLKVAVKIEPGEDERMVRSKETQMVKKYKRKTTKASWDEDVMQLAMEEAKRTTVLGAAKKYGLKLTTLQQHIKKGCHKKKLGRYRPIFTDDQEKELLELCQSDSLDGLTRKEFLIIAYEYAEAKNISNPFKNGAAGVDWYFGFKKRHPGFNLARATSAENLYKVDAFCQLLEKKMKFDLKVAVKIEPGEDERMVRSKETQVSAICAILRGRAWLMKDEQRADSRCNIRQSHVKRYTEYGYD